MTTATSRTPSIAAEPANRSTTKVRYARSGAFFAELKHRVAGHFEAEGLAPRDQPGMYLKTAVILAWLAGSYLALLLWASAWWMVVPLAISVGLAMAAVGFNIQHDGGHGAYSQRAWVNRAMALSMDAIGASSYVWNWKHNVVHHTYVNIAEVDSDIELGVWGRLAPSQPWRPVYRFQHLYLWPLYSFLALKWLFVDDFRDLATGSVGTQAMPRPKPVRLAGILSMKLVFVGLALVLPLLLKPVAGVALGFGVALLTLGFVTSIVFQLAHIVDDAEFPVPDAQSQRMEQDWAVHQLQTTVDFARKSRVLTWFLGGLNFQIEHHLFPKICHLHYPALAPIVEATCAEFGVRYRAYPTAFGALKAHAAWLKEMGAPTVEPLAAPDAQMSPLAGECA